jgi:MoxR-like ATPase
LVALLAGGHLLTEDVPGAGKTTLARSIAGCRRLVLSSVSSSRATFYPRISLGSLIYNQHEGAFEFKPGPIFANVVLADENPKSVRRQRRRAACLEAMAEEAA